VNIKAAVIFSALRFYVGYDDGTIWMTDDGGTSWTQCIMPGISGHVWSGINDLCAIDEHVIWGSGYTNVGADEWGVAFRTISGGEQWEYWQTAVACDTGVGLNAIACCSVNHAFAVGFLESAGYTLIMGKAPGLQGNSLRRAIQAFTTIRRENHVWHL